MHEIRDCEGKRLQPFDIITNSQFHYSVSPSNVLAYFLTHWQMAEKKSSLDEFCFGRTKASVTLHWPVASQPLVRITWTGKKTACQVKASNEIPPMSLSRWKHQRMMLIKLTVNFKEKFNTELVPKNESTLDFV